MFLAPIWRHPPIEESTIPRRISRTDEAIQMMEPEHAKFDATTFLAKAGLGRKIVRVKAKHVFFSQGNPADSVFYLQKGRA